MLLPPSVHELVPAGHEAHFVRDLVRDSLDLSAILDDYSQAGAARIKRVSFLHGLSSRPSEYRFAVGATGTFLSGRGALKTPMPLAVMGLCKV
jgi:hypothetical protein